jgi:hypothetical protein
MKRFAWLAGALLLTSAAGCVTRTYVISSDPPGAIVYRNGQPIGATPVEENFVYYGKYHFRLVKDGFEPLDVDQEIPAPWYEWPPLDAVSEILNPYKLRDVHRFHYALQPALPVRPDDVRSRADALRSQGQRIGPPRPAPAPAAAPAAPAGPPESVPPPPEAPAIRVPSPGPAASRPAP